MNHVQALYECPVNDEIPVDPSPQGMLHLLERIDIKANNNLSTIRTATEESHV
jgi:hypothetical protein